MKRAKRETLRLIIIHKRPSLGPEFAERERAREGGGAGAESGGTNRERNYKSGLKNGTTDTIRMMRCVNARCVSIGLVLALSNCSESGGEPDAMLDMHHPGTGIDSHHPQFHNSYGNMKFIIIVAINPTNRGDLSEPEIAATNIARARARAVLFKSSMFCVKSFQFFSLTNLLFVFQAHRICLPC